jgi:hypothetical protein
MAPTEGVGPLSYDGHVDAWFEDEESYHATLASPEWQALNADAVGMFDDSTLTPLLQGAAVNEYIMRWDARPESLPYLAARVVR